MFHKLIQLFTLLIIKKRQDFNTCVIFYATKLKGAKMKKDREFKTLVSVSLTSTVIKKLDKISSLETISRAELIRNIIASYLQNNTIVEV